MHTFALILQESWFLIKGLRLYIYSKYELSAKVKSMVLRNDVFTTARYHYSNTDHDYHLRLGP